jgi:hypothetical protein
MKIEGKHVLENREKNQNHGSNTRSHFEKFDDHGSALQTELKRVELRRLDTKATGRNTM